MLVLSRHRSQGVEFPECGISISVLETTSNRVRIGVNAPKDITILRSELADSLTEQGTTRQRTSVRSKSSGGLDLSDGSCTAVALPNLGAQASTGSPLQQRRHLEQARRVVEEIAAKHLDDTNEHVRLLLDRFQGNVEILLRAMVATEASSSSRSHAERSISAEQGLHNVAEGSTQINKAKREPRLPSDSQQAGIESNCTPSLRRALLVDDNANESKLLAGFLRLRDYDVQVANDGLSAINYLVDNKAPDVVLLDMAMPNMDGATTIRAIRNEPCFQSLPVIAVSGGTAQDYGVSVGADGVNGWLQKPLDPEALVRNIEHVVNAITETKETEARRSSSAKERLTGCGSSGVR